MLREYQSTYLCVVIKVLKDCKDHGTGQGIRCALLNVIVQ